MMANCHVGKMSCWRIVMLVNSHITVVSCHVGEMSCRIRDPGSEIRDEKMLRSRSEIKHPGYATLRQAA
jgi:hypothetical protein